MENTFKLNPHLKNLMPKSSIIAYDNKFIEALTSYINTNIIVNLQDTEILKEIIKLISNPEASIDELNKALKDIIPYFEKKINIQWLKEHLKKNRINIRKEWLIDRLLRNYINLNLEEIRTSGQLIEVLKDWENNKQLDIELSEGQKSIAIYVIILIILLNN